MLQLLIASAKRWSADKASRLAAALAYYTIFSLAPLLIVVIQLVALVLGGGHAEGHHHVARDLIESDLRSVLGPSAAQAVLATIDATLREQRAGVFAAIISWVVLLLGAIGLVGALQDALNTVWHVEAPQRGWMGALRDRLASFALVAATAFVLLVSLLANAALAAASAHVEQLFGGTLLVTTLSLMVSFAAVAALFAIIFKFLPDAETDWPHVVRGALVSAVLFVLGQAVLAWYLGRVGTTSTYGAAGSLVVILLWVFYSAQILLFGAEFTVVSASKNDTPKRPRRGARARKPTI